MILQHGNTAGDACFTCLIYYFFLSSSSSVTLFIFRHTFLPVPSHSLFLIEYRLWSELFRFYLFMSLLRRPTFQLGLINISLPVSPQALLATIDQQRYFYCYQFFHHPKFSTRGLGELSRMWLILKLDLGINPDYFFWTKNPLYFACGNTISNAVCSIFWYSFKLYEARYVVHVRRYFFVLSDLFAHIYPHFKWYTPRRRLAHTTPSQSIPCTCPTHTQAGRPCPGRGRTSSSAEELCELNPVPQSGSAAKFDLSAICGHSLQLWLACPPAYPVPSHRLKLVSVSSELWRRETLGFS